MRSPKGVANMAAIAVLTLLIIIAATPALILDELLGTNAESGMPTKEEWRGGASRFQL